MLRNRRARSVVRRAVLPLMEGLEGRTLLSAALTHSGTLLVLGTPHADVISVAIDSQNSSMIDVTVNGNVQSFAVGSVGNIVVNGGGGNDTISIAPSVTIPATVLGGGGNDSLMAGGGNDSLNGGAGNDSLVGGAGNCTLQGGAGNDTLVGGTGSDSMVGGAGNDSLMGGAGPDDLLGGPGNNTLVNGAGVDAINAGPGKNNVGINPNGGVALDTLPAAVQAGLTTLAQGATITGVVEFQADGQTYYGSQVSINGVETRIVVDSSGNPVTQSSSANPTPPPPSAHPSGLGAVVSVDATADTITVAVGNPFGPPKNVTFKLTATTTLTADGTTVALSSLTAGEFVNVQASSSDPTTATSITVLDRHVFGSVTAVDTTANTITLTGPGGVATTYTLNAKATIEVDGAASTLSAVTISSNAGLTLSALDGTVLDVNDLSQSASGGGAGSNPSQPLVAFGSIVSFDTTADTITLSVNGGTNTTYNVTSTTAIFLNGAPSMLSALTVGAQAQLKLAADGITVVAIQSETQNNPGAPGGPGQNVAFGAVASVDATADTITLTGQGGTSTTYTVTSTTAIDLDGVTTTLSGLAAGDPAILTLAADGVTALTIHAQTPPPLPPNPIPPTNPTNPTPPVIPPPVIGAVAAIDATADTITLTGPTGTSTTYTVTGTTTIMLDGAASTLGGLAVGDRALLTLASDGITVLSILAQTPPPIPTNPTPPTNPGANMPVAGPVASVDPSADTITLNPGGVSTTYNVTSTTTITLNGVNSTLSAIAAGDKALLDIAADGVTVLSIEAQTPPPAPPVMGPVVSVNPTADTITIMVGGPSGTSATYDLTNATTITLNGSASTLAALVPGTPAQLMLAADGMTVLSIQAGGPPAMPGGNGGPG